MIGWDLTDDQTEDRTRIPVLAIARGMISELGEDEQGRRLSGSIIRSWASVPSTAA